MGQVGFLLGHVLLTVAQHLREQTHKPIRLLLQHSGAEGAQVQEVACKEIRLRVWDPDRHASSPRGPLSAWGSGSPVSEQEEFHGKGTCQGWAAGGAGLRPRLSWLPILALPQSRCDSHPTSPILSPHL